MYRRNTDAFEPDLDTIVRGLFAKLTETEIGDYLGGGNCGQTALAIYHFIVKNFDKHVSIGIITDADDENDLMWGEPYVYHAFIVVGGPGSERKYDETGLIDSNYLRKMTFDQYGHRDPTQVIFDLPDEWLKIRQIIRTQTAWSLEMADILPYLD